MLNDRENILNSLRQKALNVREIMRRANVANEEVCQALLLKMRDEGVGEIRYSYWTMAHRVNRATCGGKSSCRANASKLVGLASEI